MEIQAGKSYNIKTPHTDSIKRVRKVHIDYILDDPTLTQYKDDPYYDEHKLVVYRVWIKHKGYWARYIDKYYVLCMWNDWEYHIE
jgi:hypothetical protein